MHHLIRIAAFIAVSFAVSPQVANTQPHSGNITHLPNYADHLPAKEDWLISPISQKTAVYKTDDNHLALSNGLITRTFSITPGGATIGLDNLVTGEALLRSVSPEAVLWVNGHEINVGGLVGQPIHNFLHPDFLKEMVVDQGSLKLMSWKTAPLAERFPWKPRTEWLPNQQVSHAGGLAIHFTYRADEATVQYHTQRLTSDAQRIRLLDDSFRTLSSTWKLTSTGNDVSFINEGKPGEMMGPQNHAVYAEQALPEGTKVIIVKANAGTDLSTNFGPGITLVQPDGNHTKFNLSPGNQRYAILHDSKTHSFRGMDVGKSHWLRIQLMNHEIRFDVSTDGEVYQTLTTLDNRQSPNRIRVGKTGPDGNVAAGDARQAITRSKIESVTVLGDPESPASNMDFLRQLSVTVSYEMYDGIPLLAKWITLENHASEEIIINNVRTEHLAVVEAESAVEPQNRWHLPPIFAQSDFAFASMSPNASENGGVEWRDDPRYTTQVHYQMQTPSLLVCEPKHGIGQEITKGKPFESMRLWELLYDSSDRERRGLSQRKMYRTIAPWAQENPIIMHVRSADDASVKKAIDQSAEVGFEMVIMTFGSGFSMEDTSTAHLDRMRALREYAHDKGIALGGYSLLASRSINKETDVVMPAGMKPVFGNSPCLLTDWGDRYFQTLYNFFETTGMDILEHDGSYPGDVCASCDHPGHRGLEDSQWKQFVRIRDFYRWCRSRGIYLNVPDWYFLQGSNKTGMGYRETNWSLPREYQEIIERQNIYDGTWEKTPSMGWMFVPLVEYHGGGAAATIEPLKDHLQHYEQRMANLFGAGVQACYRGPQLYDAPETKALVKKWVRFYKKHRQILDADIIHLRRPDGRDYDAILHVDPSGEEKGLLMVYNPLDEPIRRKLDIDLYYTGLKNQVMVSEQDGSWKVVDLHQTDVELEVIVPAKSQTWFVFKAVE